MFLIALRFEEIFRCEIAALQWQETQSCQSYSWCPGSDFCMYMAVVQSRGFDTSNRCQEGQTASEP